MVTDMVWNRIAFRTFLFSKSWILFTLVIFVIGTAFLKHLHEGDNSQNEMYAVFAARRRGERYRLATRVTFEYGTRIY